MSHKYNTKGISHHMLLPVIAILVVGGIGSYVMLRSSSAATKSCVQRTFSTSTNSSSVCVSYIIDLMKASGKASKAKSLSGTKFGASTKAAVQQFQSQWTSKPDGIVSANATTWSKLCSQGKSGAKTAWTKAGCGGSSTTAKKGWTSLGTTSSGATRHQETLVAYKASACKVAASSGYKVKVKFTLSAITEPSNTVDRLQNQFTAFSVNRSSNDARIGSGDTRTGAIRSTSSKTITTSTVSSSTKFYAEALRSVSESERQRSAIKKVSDLLTCP